MKKLAIFDFDGTLFDSVQDVVICLNKALEHHNFPTLEMEEYIECLGGNVDEIISKILKDNNSPENIENVKETYLNLYNPSKKENTVPFPGSGALLKELEKKGAFIAVNSNRLTYSIEFFIEKFFNDIDFISIEGHIEDSPSKPDPKGVLNIIEKANVSLEDALYIGDSNTDIKTAKNAGIDCIIVKWGYGNQEAFENEYIIEAIGNFDDLLKYF